MGALQNLEKGQFEAAFNDIETSLSNLFTNDVVPVLKAFISQFASEFGSQVLNDAIAIAPSVIEGTTTIDAAATTLVNQAGGQALTDAKTIALNAIGVIVHAPASTTATPAVS